MKLSWEGITQNSMVTIFLLPQQKIIYNNWLSLIVDVIHNLDTLLEPRVQCPEANKSGTHRSDQSQAI